jgi:hypothetical protein
MFTPASLHKFKSRHMISPRRICWSLRNERECLAPKSINICLSVGQSSAVNFMSAPICGPIEVRPSLKRLWQLLSVTTLGRRKTVQVKRTAIETIVHEPARKSFDPASVPCASRDGSPDKRMAAQNARPPARPNNPINPTARAYSIQPAGVGTPFTTVTLPPVDALWSPNIETKSNIANGAAPTRNPASAQETIPTLPIERNLRPLAGKVGFIARIERSEIRGRGSFQRRQSFVVYDEYE